VEATPAATAEATPAATAESAPEPTPEGQPSAKSKLVTEASIASSGHPGDPASAAPDPADAVLPEGPRSDADAIAALDSVTRAEAPLAADIRAPIERCESDDPLISASVIDLQMTRWWMELGKHRAELIDRSGALYTVEIGDRVGREGGRVVRIDPTEVIIGEIGFSLASEPQIVVRSIKLAR
jgi:hypothetical protein